MMHAPFLVLWEEEGRRRIEPANALTRDR